MICRASSASAAFTAMRTSPSSLTVTGNSECGTADGHERPHAVRLEQSAHDARLDVGLRRKMTTRSLTNASPTSGDTASARRAGATTSSHGRQLVDLQQDHRHVVVLRRVADERGDVAQHPLAQLVARQVRVILDQPAQPLLAVSNRPGRSSPR